MIKREKVVEGLEHCLSRYVDGLCDDCPYMGELDKSYMVPMKCKEIIMRDALALLKEQEAVQWINVNDKLPENDGQYLVVYTFFDYRAMGVVRFSHNLHEIDEYIFESKPGWYEPDDEVGYFERTTVTHWAKLPKFPDEGRLSGNES